MPTPVHWTKGEMLGAGAIGKVNIVEMKCVTYQHMHKNTTLCVHLCNYKQLKHCFPIQTV